MPAMFSYPHRQKSGQITCYLNRTYHVLTTIPALNDWQNLRRGITMALLSGDNGGRPNMDSDRNPFLITRRQFVTSSTAALALTGFLHAEQTITAPVGERSSHGTDRLPLRVIIDTDPGVDDAFALLLAMRSPELKIEAITAVAGNVPLELTLPNALRMVEIAGRADIPVAAGARRPLLRRLVTAAYAHGENGLGGAVFPEPKIKPVAEPAAVFIRQILRNYPGQVTLIPVGPLTNIATALTADPELARMVRGIVMMGG